MESHVNFSNKDKEWMKRFGVEEKLDEHLKTWRWVKKPSTHGELEFRCLPTGQVSCNINFTSEMSHFSVGAQAKTTQMAWELAFTKFHRLFMFFDSFHDTLTLLEKTNETK